MTTFSGLSISLASWRFILWSRPLPDELSTWIRFGQRDACRLGNSTAKTPRAPRGEGDVTVGHDLSGPGANQGRDPDPDCGVPALAREGLHWHQTGTVGLPILMGG